jgi:hypothetical protein
LPEEIARSCFGPGLEAAVSTLSVRNRVSRDDAVELCEELFSARISSGTVDAILSRVAATLAVPHDDLLAKLGTSQALNMDETGWKTAGQQRALWGLFDQRHATSPSSLTATRTMPGSCSPIPRRSSPLTAGGPIRTCRCAAVSSAGRTCGETSPRTPKA